MDNEEISRAIIILRRAIAELAKGHPEQSGVDSILEELDNTDGVWKAQKGYDDRKSQEYWNS